MRLFARPRWLLGLALGALAIGGVGQAASIKVPDGFAVVPAIERLHHPTRLAFGPDGRLYIAQQTGEIIAVTLREGKEAARAQVAKAHETLLGIALRGEKLWVSETGAIAIYTRSKDGRYEGRREIVSDIPHGLHQNDGFAWGPDGKLYWGLGSTTDQSAERHPWSGTIMRMNPDGSDVEVYAKGMRNPYGLAFDPAGRLWATDNGTDDPVSSDELNLIQQHGDYGFPRVNGAPPAGSPVKAPVVLFGEHNSTDGLTVYTGTSFPKRYRGGIFVAMWGSSFSQSVGRAVGFVELTQQGDRWQGKLSTFATGFSRPLDLTMGPDGDLWVADFVAGTVYRIWATSQVTDVTEVAEKTDVTAEPEMAPTQRWSPWKVAVTSAFVVALGAVILYYRRAR